MMLRLSQLLIKAIYLKEVTETIATIDRNIFNDASKELRQSDRTLGYNVSEHQNCIEILFKIMRV